jgi:SAM-dependent methyltransferase
MSELPGPDDLDAVHENVRAAYAAVARRQVSCCGGAAPDAERVARAIGYREEELRAVPDGANLGVGCGNPGAIAALGPGETVLDLGCGAGFDVFLAARAVGPEGRVIGVDMTEAMLERARANARQGDFANVEFRLGTIEELPVADASVDAVISNCVINLSPDKPRVFREAFRVLRPGGRLAVSDLVLAAPLPAALRDSVEAWVGCLAGAIPRDDYLEAIREAGFHDVEVASEASYAGVVDVQTPELREIGERAGLCCDEIAAALASVTSVKISARRP